MKFNATISRSTVNRITHASEDAFIGAEGRKKHRRVLFPEFEDVFLSFYKLNDGKAILTDALLLEEARSIRARLSIPEKDLHLSNGWLDKFKRRHGISQHVLHGEAESVNRADLALVQSDLQDLIAQYSPQNVFNFDESALFYRLPPNKTLATVKRNGKKGEKDRVTVGLCCNMDGSERMDLVVIGKSKQPRAFRQVRLDQLKFLYYYNKTAWQNRKTFDDWLRRFDRKMSGRRVLLLLDNASSHYMSYVCKNVVVQFLPPNMTSRIQPLDAGW